jgi:hypothetical protein
MDDSSEKQPESHCFIVLLFEKKTVKRQSAKNDNHRLRLQNLENYQRHHYHRPMYEPFP